MEKLILNKTSPYDRFGVVKQPYSFSDLFVKYEHTLKTFIFGGNIYICKEDSGNKMTLNLDKYKKSRFRAGYVYFNKSDTGCTKPLALVIYLGNETPKYCKYSNLGTFIDGNKTMNIDEFVDFNGYDTDRQIFSTLISENDLIYDCVTYEIDNTNDNYNEMVELKDETKSIDVLERNGFKRYFHKNKRGLPRKSYFLCNRYKLLASNEELNEIQGNEFTGIYVYTYSKIEVPLLIEAVKDDHTSDHKFYYPKKGGYTSITCEEITKTTDINGIKFRDNHDIRTQLYESNHNKLIELLLKLKLRLTKTILIVLDDRTSAYSYSLKSKEYTNTNHYDIANDQNIVVVREKTNSYGSCIKMAGYKVYEHDISTTIRGLSRHQEFQFKFITRNGNRDGDKYTELIIYESSNEEEETTIFYTKSEDKLYVYFCGSDLRPLLFSYNNQIFKAKSAEEYKEYKWCKLEDVNNLDCTGPKSNSSQILKLLNEVKEFLGIQIVTDYDYSSDSSIQDNNHHSGAIFGAIGAAACILGFCGFFAYKNNERIQRLIRRYWR